MDMIAQTIATGTGFGPNQDPQSRFDFVWGTARDLTRRYRPEIDALAEALISRNMLSSSEVNSIIGTSIANKEMARLPDEFAPGVRGIGRYLSF